MHPSISQVKHNLTDLLYSLETKGRGCIWGHQWGLNSCFAMDLFMAACELTIIARVLFKSSLSGPVCVCTLQYCGGVSLCMCECGTGLFFLLRVCKCAWVCVHPMVWWSWLIADFCVYESERGRGRHRAAHNQPHQARILPPMYNRSHFTHISRSCWRICWFFEMYLSILHPRTSWWNEKECFKHQRWVKYEPRCCRCSGAVNQTSRVVLCCVNHVRCLVSSF